MGKTVEILAAIHASRSIAKLWNREKTGNAWTYARDLSVKAWCKGPWH